MTIRFGLAGLALLTSLCAASAYPINWPPTNWPEPGSFDGPPLVTQNGQGK